MVKYKKREKVLLCLHNSEKQKGKICITQILPFLYMLLLIGVK